MRDCSVELVSFRVAKQRFWQMVVFAQSASKTPHAFGKTMSLSELILADCLILSISGI